MQLRCIVKNKTVTEDFTMDNQSVDELGIDDNGLQNASLQAFWQEIAPNDCIIEFPWNDFQRSQCDAIPIDRGAAESTEIVIDNRKSCWKARLEADPGTTSFGEPSVTTVLVKEEENEQPISDDDKDSKSGACEQLNSNVHVCPKIKKEVVEIVHGRSSIRQGEVETKEAQLRSGRSAKDGGYLKSNAHLETLSSLATLCVTSFATISLRFSISLTVGILLLMPSVGVEGSLTLVPTNTLFVVGKTARMNCSTDLNRPIYWARTLVGSDVQDWLYYGQNGFNGKNADGRFSMDKDEATGRYDVVIENVQPKDAGQYVCVDDSGIGAMASAELVASDPINCTSRIPSDGVMGYNIFGLEQDFIEISCSLTYIGNLSPTLKWSWPGSEVESDKPVVSVSTSSVTSTLKLSPTKERDKVNFQCRANIETATQNQMDSQLLWESETVNVGYATFESKEVEACPGVKWNLVCNPQCSYQFERKDNDCQCLYTYYDARTQTNYEVTSDVVKCGGDMDVLLSAILAVVAGTALLAVAILILVYCLRRKKTRRAAGGSEEFCQVRNDDNSTKAMLETI